MNEEGNKDVYRLMAAAGESRSASMRAIEEARNGRFDESVSLLKQAEDLLELAGGLLRFLLPCDEAEDDFSVDIMTVHAQDHMTMAILTKERAEESLCLYRIIYSLKEKEEKAS